ncbi:DnaD/phage-associated family protein [Lederbergia galactosidilyticus]|uniref:DnaD domain-containing protein n=1 Tax=Lederbergia galactosidilytica TaxID=217031 RepID=UPI001AE78BC8|nr:DnaD domain protein [Lederbergia galactosidilytica]MBP1913074.1 DnaD/phage-associated family protein [Lederbergia galactosidilytica]
MAKFRMINIGFWDDPKVVEEMTPEDKYLFLYLLTNANTTQIGIYSITKKQMAFDTGYSMEAVNNIFERLIQRHKLMKYNPKTRELAIRNWGKYNFNRGGKPVEDCVMSELSKVKDRSLITFVGEHVKQDRIRELYESYADTGTLRGQEKEEEEEQDKEQEQELEWKRIDHGGGENVVDFYQQNFGMLSPYMAEELIDAIENFGERLVIKAMKISLASGNRSWRYTYGILKKWRYHNVKTIEDVIALDREYEQQREYSGKQAWKPDYPTPYQHNPSEGEEVDDC